MIDAAPKTDRKSVQKGAQKSDRTTSAQLLASAVGIWDWDVAEHRLRADGRFAELYGLDRRKAAKGVATNAFFEAIHPDDRMRIRIAVAGVMHGADIFTKQYRLLDGDGSVRWVSAEGRVERNADRRTVRFSGLLTDITELKRVEERLRVAQSAGGIGTFEYVSGFGTVEVSRQFCRLLGLSPTDSVALRTINAILPGEAAPLIGGPEDVEGELPYREFKIVRPDTGEVRWIARRGELRRDGPAGGLRYIGVIHDVTAFKTVEGRLRELTTDLEHSVAERTRERDRVWNNSRDLLVVVGADGIFRSASPSWTRILGLSAEELVGHSYKEFVVAEDLEPTAAALQRAVDGEERTDFENRYRHKEGGFRWVSWRTTREADLVYAYGRDITEEKGKSETLRRTEEQLRQSQKMEAVGQLTGGLAHDFNNMLTGVIGGLDMVRKRICEGRLDDVDRFMDGALTSAHRAAGLTHRLLAFSRQQSLDPKPVDVAALVQSMEDLLRRTLGEQVSLKVMIDVTPWAAVSDVNQLESALLNLAINARDAMPKGGQLTIEAKNASLDEAYVLHHADATVGDYVVLSVTDTGVGMTPDVAAKAFEPFFTTKPIGQGTGLGLSMIYGFMRQIGGHATLYSELGRGTTIRLYLPRFSGEAEDPEDAALAPEHVGAGERVLVIEDEESVRMLVVEVLRELGYVAFQAANGAAALDLIKSSQPLDLLVTDVGLPGLNGRQVAEIAREHRPGLRVLFVTGYAPNAAVRSNFLDPGMEMISKPFAMKELSEKIREMLSGGRAARA
jgi:PAS domain S-box-containing protein